MMILLPDEDLSTLEEKVIRENIFLTRGSGDIDWGSRRNLTTKGVDWKSTASIHSAHPAKVGLGLVALTPPPSSSASQQASRPAWSSLSPSWGSPKLSTPGKPTLVRSPTRRGWRSQTSFTRLSLRLTLIIPSKSTFIAKVDEEGSEAAALTGIILDIRTARVPQVITVDRSMLIYSCLKGSTL